MKLLAYMKREGINDEAMAALVGGCTASAIKKYKYGEREPDAKRIRRIAEITLGKVGLDDWGSGAGRHSRNRKPKAPTTTAAPKGGHAVGGGR